MIRIIFKVPLFCWVENRLQRAEGGAGDSLGEERREAARFGVQDVPAIWESWEDLLLCLVGQLRLVA